MLDLVDALGEAWCVTVAPVSPSVALRRMGGAVEFAREPAPGWCVVVQIDGTAGWIGERAEVLGPLATRGVACSAVRDPNRAELLIAERGALRGGLDLVTGRRWGRSSLDAVPPGPSGSAAVHAIEAVTGVTLTARTFG